MNEPISSIMQRIVSPVSMDDSVEQVEAILNAHGFSSVPVYDTDGAILGIITARDLMRFHAWGKDPKAVRAWEICTYRPLEVTPDTPIIEVAKLMLTHKIHHVIVMENELVKGVVSSLDFVRLLVEGERS